jgi:hypothetical protein
MDWAYAERAKNSAGGFPEAGPVVGNTGGGRLGTRVGGSSGASEPETTIGVTADFSGLEVVKVFASPLASWRFVRFMPNKMPKQQNTRRVNATPPVANF